MAPYWVEVNKEAQPQVVGMLRRSVYRVVREPLPGEYAPAR